MSSGEASASSRTDARRRAIRIGAVTAAVLVAALCAWQIVAVAQARALAERQPDIALAWRGGEARALSALAERDFLDAVAGGRPTDTAREQARRALRVNPLDVRAVRVLGWVAEAEGDERRALRLMSLAASRSQRDVSSHLWMFHNRLRARDYSAAFAHGDALMRHSSTLRETAVLMASAAGNDQAATAAIIRRLQTQPAWRSAFIRELAASQDPDVTLSILLAVKESGVAIGDEEAAALAARLFRVERPREAYLAWVLLLPPAGYDVLDNVYNGGFEGPPGAGPFAWTFPRRGAQIAQAPGREGKALLAEFDGGKERVLASQTLVLAPGVYRLTLDSRLDRTGRGEMTWALACGGRAPGSLARIAVPSSSDWKPVSGTLSVPATDCEVQRIELRASGHSNASVWGRFDNIRVELLAGGT